VRKRLQMLTLLEHGELYAPEARGRQSVLLCADRIARIGALDRRALEATGLELSVVDATGCVVTPGFIDPHVHLTGGSGERGFSTQTPEIFPSELIAAGVTTVVGCLGVDTTTKTMAGLLARAKAINEEGLAAYIYTGGYNVPPTTLTGSIRTDIMFVAEVIGAGETAISDVRATEPEVRELARLVSEAYVGGLLSRKAGVTHFHVGDGRRRLEPLRVLLNDYDVEPAWPFIYVADMPVTMNGTAEFQIANVMAAAAAARAYGLTSEQVAAALREFDSSHNNPGRANLYQVKGGYVMIDYGHNADAFAAVCRMAAQWAAERVTGIIGVPGDRDDSVIEQAGRIAARGFHRIIIKEDKDTRGRAPGEVARLLCAAVQDEAPRTECQIVLDETQALRFELETIEEGQIVVVFYDKLEPMMKLLAEFGARPVATVSAVQWVGAPQANAYQATAR
jgi:Mur ligase family, glutamate ligase domain/Amidohydrolase family